MNKQDIIDQLDEMVDYYGKKKKYMVFYKNKVLYLGGSANNIYMSILNAKNGLAKHFGFTEKDVNQLIKDKTVEIKEV